MDKLKKATILLYIASGCFFLTGILNLTMSHKTLGIIYLCLGVTFCCLGMVNMKNYKKSK